MRQIGCAYPKASFWNAQQVYLAREILAELTAANFCDWRGNPSGFPLMPRRNKATEGRRRAMFAAKPSYTCCSLSPKISHRCARCDFRGSRYFLRAHHITRVDFTLSVRQGIAKLSARAKSVVFALASNYSKTKNSRKIAAERDFREQGGGAEAETSNARQGIARNLPRAQPTHLERNSDGQNAPTGRHLK